MNQTKNKYATASLVLGILSIVTGCFCLGGLLGILGIVFFVLSNKSNGRTGVSTAGLVTSIIGILIALTMLALFSQGSTTDETSSTTTEAITEKEDSTTEVTTEAEEPTAEATTEAEEPTTEATTEESISEDDFKNSCESLSYKDLLRNPDDYIGKNIKIDLKISQVGISGGLFSDTEYMRAYSNDEYDLWLGDVYVLTDSRTDDSTKILVDDVISVYGTFTGLTEFEMALTGTTEEYPVIDMKYMVLIGE